VGMQEHGRQSRKETIRPIVAFDFDGTLTVRDSFNAFLRWRVPAWAFEAGLIHMSPYLIGYLFNRDRGKLKARAVREFLAGRSVDEIGIEAEGFCDAVWDRFMRPDALAKWEEWREKGALLAIVTASPDLTVAPFARRLNADVLLGTRLKVDAAGVIQGPLEGENCRAGEKVTRLRAHFGEDVRLAAAYGDTSGDTEMLAIADEPGFRVFTGRP